MSFWSKLGRGLYKKSPTFPRNTNIFPHRAQQKSPIFWQKSPAFPHRTLQQSPTFAQKSPTFAQKSPTFAQKSPTFAQKSPTFPQWALQQSPTLPQKPPTIPETKSQKKEPYILRALKFRKSALYFCTILPFGASHSHVGCLLNIFHVMPAIADMSQSWMRVKSHMRKRHVTHMDESCHTWSRWVRVEHVIPAVRDKNHIWMSHVTHMDGSCSTYEWVMSHIWMSHVPHGPVGSVCKNLHFIAAITEMLLIWMSHVTHMHETRHKYEWVMSHIECDTDGRVVSHVWLSHVTRDHVASG